MKTLEELLALWNDEATRADMSREDRDDLLAKLQERAEAIVEAGNLGADEVAELGEIRTTVEAVVLANTAEDTEAAAREAEAAEAIEAIRNASAGGDGEDGDGNEGGDGDADADADADPEASTDADADADADADGKVPVAAAGYKGPKTKVTRVAARRPKSSEPATLQRKQLAMTASANVPGMAPGQVLESHEDFSAAFQAAIRASANYQGPRVQIPVIRIGDENAESVYGADRFLSRDPVLNEQRIADVTSLSAITAAGGICVPSPIDYSQPVLSGTNARPARDSLARFGADRGGVTTLGVPVIEDVMGATGVWTDATDQNPGNSTKPCLELTCPDDATTVVDAITQCFKVSNFRSRFFGEQVQAWMSLADTWTARYAERRMLTTIGAGSTQVTAQELLGTTRNVLAVLDRAVAVFKNRHRLADEFPFRWLAPRWLRDQIRTDLARQLPVGSVDETLAVADAMIEQFFTARRLNVTWLLEGETGQDWGVQGDGPLAGWPDSVVTYLFPEGTWLHLDGGTLDLGMVRDATLVQQNRYLVFGEFFEDVHFHGVESWRISMDVCPDGSVSGTVDIDPCSSGS